MQHILESLIVELKAESPCIIATIIGSSGSTPRTSGARMLVRRDGSIGGSVGGGSVEGSCVATALKMISNGNADIVRKFDLKPTMLLILE